MRYAIIVAAGESKRFGSNKLDELLLGKSVLSRSVDLFKSVADIVVVVGRRVPGTIFAEGGATRFLSVRSGLHALPLDARGTVAVHDCARPFVPRVFVENLFNEAEKHGSAIPRLFVTDTIYCHETGGDKPVDRSNYFTVQTPQVFDIAALRAAFDEISSLRRDGDYTDESTLFADVGNKLHFVDGLRSNIKLTYRDDMPDFRIGSGFDVHPFEQGDSVILGGVAIPFIKKLKGHSDADALCHAICDAVLSASGNKDIGHQFPDSDPTYAGADSTKLLERCVGLAEANGYEVINVSAVVICQEPKIAPYIDAMAVRLAQICKVTPDCISISATTTEHLGALGNGDGIAAEAVALLRKI